MRFIHGSAGLGGQRHGQCIAGLFNGLVRHGVEPIGLGEFAQIQRDDLRIAQFLRQLHRTQGGLHMIGEQPDTFLRLCQGYQGLMFHQRIAAPFGEGERRCGVAMGFNRFAVHHPVGGTDQRLGPLVSRDRALDSGT